MRGRIGDDARQLLKLFRKNPEARRARCCERRCGSRLGRFDRRGREYVDIIVRIGGGV
jgi:hypothetical protein